MSLFQCDKCGCEENTAAAHHYHSRLLFTPGRCQADALAYYRQALGLKEGAEYGYYCSACDPVWYTKEGDYGVGPPPPGMLIRNHPVGTWHGRFPRRYLPKGMFHTDEAGNLRHIVTLESPTEWFRDEEWPEVPRTWKKPNALQMRLPPPDDAEASERWRQLFGAVASLPPEQLAEPGKLFEVVAELVKAGATVELAKPDLHDVFEKYRGATLQHKRHRSAMQMVASVAALAASAMPERRPQREPAPPTEEEVQRDEERQARKIAKAQERREKRAAKRKGPADRAGGVG